MEKRPIHLHLGSIFGKSIKFMDKIFFNDSRWTIGRCLGIAWGTSELFNIKVWSETDIKCQNGQ